jgi:hypothetical protein
MRQRQSARTPASLEAAKRRFEAWRRRQRWLGRIPKELWRIAVETAAVHGVDATARVLLVSPTRLKQLMGAPSHAEPGVRVPQFVEIPPLPVGPPAECTLELEDSSGRKLRILLKGQATSQAVALGQLLWKGDA